MREARAFKSTRVVLVSIVLLCCQRWSVAELLVRGHRGCPGVGKLVPLAKI